MDINKYEIEATAQALMIMGLLETAALAFFDNDEFDWIVGVDHNKWGEIWPKRRIHTIGCFTAYAELAEGDK